MARRTPEQRKADVEQNILNGQTLGQASSPNTIPRKPPRHELAETDPGDNAKYMSCNLELLHLPEVDMMDDAQVAQRIDDFFAIYLKYDMKPTVAGLALVLNNISRTQLTGVVSGKIKTKWSKNTIDVLKKAYNVMENMWETYMNSGKINPVSGIFLGKNNYGYQDKTEYVVTPHAPDEQLTAEEIRKRYSVGSDAEALPDGSPVALSDGKTED